jgi:uncharacterized membrane protein
MRYEIRELGVGGTLDQAIAVTKDHFWLFFKIVVVLFLPLSLIYGWLVAWNIPPNEASTSAWVVIVILAIVNGWVVFPLTNAAIIYAVASCYLNRPITVGLAFQRARRIFLPLLGTTILLSLVVMAGFLLLFVPGIIFLLWYFLTIQVVVLEGLSGQAALKRSRQLMKGNIGAAFLLGLLVWVITMAASGMQALIPQVGLKVSFNAVVQTVVLIFGTAAWVVFYFSCRAKAEHFDLALLADAVGVEDDQSTGTLNVSPGEGR